MDAVLSLHLLQGGPGILLALGECSVSHSTSFLENSAAVFLFLCIIYMSDMIAETVEKPDHAEPKAFV